MTAGGARHRPAKYPVEVRLACSGILVAVALAGPAVGFGWWAAGRDGALSAGIGAGIVIAMIGISAGLLAFLARFGPAAVTAGALGGFAVRMMLYATMVAVLDPMAFVHGPSLAITSAVLLMAALFREAQVLTRAPELSWIEAGAPLNARAPANVVYTDGSAPAGGAGRSRTTMPGTTTTKD